MPIRSPVLWSPSSDRRGSRGQVIIEYILLMVVVLGIAAFIMREVISREKGNEGFLMKRWQGMLDQVSKDDPNKRTNGQ